jgi:hypothetical protein
MSPYRKKNVQFAICYAIDSQTVYVSKTITEI